MSKKVSKILLLALIFSTIIVRFEVANSNEILWNPGVANDLSGSKIGLVPGAKIRNTGILVNKPDPDELIMKVIMNESFEDRPFSSSIGRNLGMWIYWPTNYCFSSELAKCSGLYSITIPDSPLVYPTTESSEYVFVKSHNQTSNVEIKSTNCKAPWWLESTYKSRDTWAFSISITCLGIPKEFGWYAFSSIDIGQTDVVYDFTSVQMISYPFHDLALKSFEKKNRSTSENSSSKEICVTASMKTSDFVNEQCINGKKWAFEFCDLKPKSELQVKRGKNWLKVETKYGLKKKAQCSDDANFSGYYFYEFDGELNRRYRIKTYGKNYSTEYIDLVIVARSSGNL